MTANQDKFELVLDTLAQQPGLQVYTQIALCYAMPDQSPEACSSVVRTLTGGLERLTASFPWIAGQVVEEDGVFKIKPHHKIPPLIVKDHSKDLASEFPTMDRLREAKFPMGMLDESLFAPRKTLQFLDAEKDIPAFIVQATFISGGLVLTLLGDHKVMDGVGQGRVIDLLAKACGPEAFTDEELKSGNVDRSNTVPLLDTQAYDALDVSSELADQIKRPVPAGSAPDGSGAPPKVSWLDPIFPHSSLAAMKASATEDIKSTGSSAFVSTDDVLTAFIWQSILRARLPRLGSPETLETCFARAVSVRQIMGISEAYLGVLQNMTYHTFTVRKLVDMSLGELALNLRSGLDSEKLEFNTRVLATYQDRAPDKSVISPTANLEFFKDLVLSSWAKLDCYRLDFNLGLGTPEAVRRPQFTPVEGLLYLMPKTLDGEISAALGLREEDISRLRSDEQFNKFARWTG